MTPVIWEPPALRERPLMIEIRTEHPADRKDVFAVNAAAFETAAEAELVEAVRGATARGPAEPLISLVAVVDSTIAGHILFTPVTVEDAGVPSLAMGLGPMAVRPDHQRQGLGSRLVRAGLDACRQIGEDVVFVLGHAEYYPRFGFEPAPAKGLRYRSAVFDPHFFVTELRPGALVGLSGWVRYHPEFEKF